MKLNVDNEFDPAKWTDVAMINGNMSYLSNGNFIWKTSDGGTTWSQILKIKANIIEIHFIDDKCGWACTTDGRILRFRS